MNYWRLNEQTLIKVITGIRRCGKSTLFELYQEYLEKQGILAQQIISINFEDMDYEELVFGRLTEDQSAVVVINKTDRVTGEDARDRLKSLGLYDRAAAIVDASASQGQGIEEIERKLIEISGASDIAASDVVVTNARHHRALVDAEASITRAIDGINASLSGDFIAQDLRETLHHLSTITGTITTDTILQNIFTKFCIGK